MKTKNLFTGMVAVLIATTLFLVSCEKDKTNQISSEDLELAEDEAFSDAVFEDLMNEIDAAEPADQLKSTLLGCANVTTTVVDTVWTITIDYGDGCEQIIQNRFGVNIDTIVRKGKVIITRYGRYKQKNSFRTVTLDGYSVNGIQIEGTRTVRNKGYDNNGHMWFTISLQNGKITTPDGIEITRNSERERHWIAGESTSFRGDDEFKIWGTVYGVTANGETYTHNIVDSLHVKLACRFIVSGQIEFMFGTREPVVLDYGDGECDAKATLSRNGETKEITLRFRPKPRLRRILRLGN